MKRHIQPLLALIAAFACGLLVAIQFTITKSGANTDVQKPPDWVNQVLTIHDAGMVLLASCTLGWIYFDYNEN